jgi:predicted Zn-dependent peptidase
MMTVGAGTAPEHLDEVLALVHAELDDLGAHGVDAHELELAQGYLCGATLLGLEDTSSRMARLAAAVQVDDEVRPVDDALAKIRAVTLADVAELAGALRDAPRVVALVGAVDD